MHPRIASLALVLVLAPMVLGACTSATFHYGHASGRPDHDDTATHRALRIPPGHLPPPGSCRIWFPGTPPGHQPPPGDCARLAHEVPRGAWLLHRPYDEPAYVDVSVYDERQSAVAVEVRIYEAETGRFVGFRGETAHR